MTAAIVDRLVEASVAFTACVVFTAASDFMRGTDS